MMDGGTIWNTNLVTAIQRCRDEVGAADHEITVDVIICGHTELKVTDSSNAYSNYMAWKEINSYHGGLNDIFEFKQGFPNVNFRYFIQPDHNIGGPLSALDFANSTNTWLNQEMGRSDGVTALRMGEGHVFKLMDQWRDSADL